MRRTLVFLLIFLASGAWAAEGPDLHITGVRLVGGDAELDLGPWFTTFGAGVESFSLGRDSMTGAPLTASAAADPSKPYQEFWLPNAVLTQGYQWPLAEALVRLQAGAYAWDRFGEANGPGAVADEAANFVGFGRLTIERDRRTTDAHGGSSGPRVLMVVEGGPSALAWAGTEYLKASLSSSIAIPLWDLPGPHQLWSGAAAFRANTSWIDGAAVPLLLREPTEVRGFHETLDARWRSVASVELRVRGPSLWGAKDLVPVGFAFTDLGWNAGYSDAPASAADRQQALASTGFGGGVDVLGLVTPTVTLAWPWAGPERDLWIHINFSLAY